MITDCEFTFFHYEKILDLVNNSNYKTVFFNGSHLNDRELIIRHDIDLDLGQAYRMALIENKHQIKTTFFIMVRSPFYNIFEKANSDLVNGILDMGHQIGLHYDEAYYCQTDTQSVIEHVDSEVRLLKSQFNTEIYAVSFHRPSQFILHTSFKLNNGLINTYDSDFAREFKYISDSGRMWKNGCLCRFIDKADCLTPKIQALVHPIWWNDESMSAKDTMERFLHNKLKIFDSELEKNMRIYKRMFS